MRQPAAHRRLRATAGAALAVLAAWIGLGILAPRPALAATPPPVAGSAPQSPKSPSQSATAPASRWSEADIRASRVLPSSAAGLSATPRWNADPLNLIVVIEAAGEQVSLVDGDRFERIARFPMRHVPQGEPLFTADGRHAFFASADGWISKVDLWNAAVVAEVRAGLELRRIALSGDGRWLMAANCQPHTLELFDSALNLVRSYAATTLDGKSSSCVSAVHDAARRQSFVVAMRDIAELWEISYDPRAEPIFDGLVHDYKLGEGIAKPGTFGVRRTLLEVPLDHLWLDPGQRQVVGVQRPAAAASGASAPGDRSGVQVVNLDIRRKIADLSIAGSARPDAGTAFAWNGGTALAMPNQKLGVIDLIDLRSWKPVKTIATPGPGLAVAGHPNTSYAWTDSALSADARDTLTVIDTRTLTAVAQVRQPGRALGQVEFTRDGRHALVALREADGALIVYDARSFQERKRLPMSQPAGHYSVGNRVVRPHSAPR